MGTLWAYDRRGRMPGDRELHVLQSIAAQVAAVLERAVLLRESASQLRLQRELEVCSESTRGGDVASLIGEEAGFEAAGACTSRYEIGGDLCELVPLEPGRTVVAVGDASGDSIPAALVMSSVRGALRTLSQVDGIEPGDRTDRIVQRLSRSLYDLTPAHQFMSLFYGLYDRPTRTLTYTNAGHPTPLLLHDGQISTLNSHGMLLGVLPDATYERSSLVLAPGDVLVLYSDGVSEAMSRRRQMFRSDGIVGALRGQAVRSARELFERIWNGLAEHVAGHDGGDDRTLLVLKVREGR
jgi:sigma-B regulation protein RsbU (phosphoserine phosphatase)